MSRPHSNAAAPEEDARQQGHAVSQGAGSTGAERRDCIAPPAPDQAGPAAEARAAVYVADMGPSHARIMRRYLIASIACAAFALIYAQFSHGVHSLFMTLLFMIPLVLGVLPALMLHIAKARPLPRVSRQAWALAVASLTIASCLKGIFDIAGTSSPYLVIYIALAAVFAVLALGNLVARCHAGNRCDS